MHPLVRNFNQRINQWLKGNFSASDERALNTLAKDDKDISDALEGYMQMPDANHDAALQRLRERLNPSDTHKTPFRFAFPSFSGIELGKWAAVAASVLCIFAAYWIFRAPDKHAKETIATTEVPIPQQAPSTGTHALLEESEPATAPANQDVAMAPMPKASKSIETRSKSSQKAEEKLLDETAQAMADKQSDVAVVATSAPVAANKTMPAVEPVSDAIAGAKPGRQASSTEKARKINEGATKAKKTQAPPASPAPSKDKYFETDKKPNPVKEEVPVLEPSGGWNAYDLYLRDMRVYPTEAAQLGIVGSVRLSFWTDKDGKPIQIRVMRSLGYGCDEEAIRLLSEGPIWTPALFHDGVLEVRFPR